MASSINIYLNVEDRKATDALNKFGAAVAKTGTAASAAAPAIGRYADVLTKLGGGASSVSPAVSGAATAIGKVAPAASKAGAAVEGMAAKMTGLKAAMDTVWSVAKKVYQGLVAVANELDEASRASAEQEESLIQLGSALRATGKSAEISVKQIAKIAAELQKTTKFGDEVTISAAKWFAQMPSLKSDEASMRGYITTAQDLAEVMGGSLTGAVQVLARALEDPRRASRALRRANIMLSTSQRDMLILYDELGMETEGMTLVQAAAAASVGGAAEDMALSLKGVQSQIRGISSDLYEHFGKVVNEVITPISFALKDQLEVWSEWSGELTSSLYRVREEVYDTLEAMERLTDADQSAALDDLVANMNALEVAGHGVAGVFEAASQAMMMYTVVSQATNVSSNEVGLTDMLMAATIGTTGAAAVKAALSGTKKLGEARFKEFHRQRIARMEEKKEERRKKKAELDAQVRIDKANALAKKAAIDRQKAREREFKTARSWVEQGTRSAMSAAEKAISDMKRINELRRKGWATEAERLKIAKELGDEYEKSFGLEKKRDAAAKGMEKANKDSVKIAKKIIGVNEKLAKARAPKKFSSSITDAAGAYWSMTQGAASRDKKDETVKELQQQREQLRIQWVQSQRARWAAARAMMGVERNTRALSAARRGGFS